VPITTRKNTQGGKDGGNPRAVACIEDSPATPGDITCPNRTAVGLYYLVAFETTFPFPYCAYTQDDRPQQSELFSRLHTKAGFLFLAEQHTMNSQLKFVACTVVLGSMFAINVASAAPANPNHTINLHSELLGDSNITTYQWGAGIGVSSQSGGNRTVSVPSVSELTLTRYVDSISPLFFNALTSGDPIGTVVISDGALTIELREVIISGYSLSASDGATPQQNPRAESISLNFTRVIYSVDDGSACYDLATNVSAC